MIKKVFQSFQGVVPVKIWTDDVDQNSLDQLSNISGMPFIHKHVAAMPDVHLGIGATIGSVIPTLRAVIPAAVGVDLGCLDAETEFLSPTGWVRFDEWSGSKVCQYDLEKDVATLVDPIRYIKNPTKKLLYFKSDYGLNQKVTFDHKVLFFYGTKGRGYKPAVSLADDFTTRHSRLKKGVQGGFKTVFAWGGTSGLRLSEAEIRLSIMIAADGRVRSCKTKDTFVELHFKKVRKIERAKKLLEDCGIPFKSYQVKDLTTYISFSWGKAEKTLDMFWSASSKQLEVFCDEILKWDGHRGAHEFFCTSKKSEADITQFAFATIGVRCGIFETTYPNNKSWKSTWTVYKTKNIFVGMSERRVKEVDNVEGFAYCFTVPSGFLVVRRGGNIFITGNCGMQACRLDLRAEDLPDNLKAVRSEIEKNIPHGRTDDGGRGDRGAWGYIPKDVEDSYLKIGLHNIQDLLVRHPKLISKRVNSDRHLGTLGTGNHFIEICLDEKDRVWVMLHSGSRGVGNRIGSYFIRLAKEDMRKWFVNLPDKDLAYFPEGTDHFSDYVKAVEWAQRFALENRKLMMARTISALLEVLGRNFVIQEEVVDCHHNYISREHHYGKNVIVTRKGAIRARKGDLGIIPGSMGAKSYIVAGKGNPESFNSCSHGAGRKMSRTQARNLFSKEDLIAQTKGIECPKDEERVDEIPSAYKNMDVVMENQKDLVEVVHTLRQVVNVKG